jgi:hypothetical protein
VVDLRLVSDVAKAGHRKAGIERWIGTVLPPQPVVPLDWRDPPLDRDGALTRPLDDKRSRSRPCLTIADLTSSRTVPTDRVCRIRIGGGRPAFRWFMRGRHRFVKRLRC